MSTSPRTTGDEEVLSVLRLARTGSPRKRRLIVAGVALLLLVIIAAIALRRPKPVHYETAEVARGTLHVEVSATGTVQALSTVEVGAEVTARALEVLVDFNDHVKVGQLLVQLDPETYRAQVRESQAQIAAADASVRQAIATDNEARATLERSQAESASGLVSPRDLDAAKAAAARATAAVAAARAQAQLARASLANAQTRLDKTRITSPIDGLVLDRKIDPGQTVTAGFQTPVLFTLAEDLSRMSLHVLVDEADVGSVKEGQDARFTVDAYPDHVFPSKVLSVRNQPTTTNNVVSYEAILEIDNSELLLRPGMTASATIVAKVLEDIVLVPDAAFRFAPPTHMIAFGGPPPPQEAPGSKLWLLENGKPKSVPAKRGASDGTLSQVVGEIPVGARVILDQQEGRP